MGFCGEVNFENRRVSFSVLKEMQGHGKDGCAFIDGEIGMLCDCERESFEQTVQPVTLRYNDCLYTAAIISPFSDSTDLGSSAQAILEGYIEEGDTFICRLDFSFALALYDSRCGELLLAKGPKGDRALFYTVRDGALFFSTSLRSLIRLYGGCVRVNAKLLTDYLNADTYRPMPMGLFPDITLLRPNHRLICSCFGHTCYPISGGVAIYAEGGKAEEYPESVGRENIKKSLDEALFAFGYPQFDCYMPYHQRYFSSCAARGVKTVCVCDPTREFGVEYAEERIDRLGSVWGLFAYGADAQEQKIPKRDLKRMDRELDSLLDKYISERSCAINALEGISLDTVKKEKSIALRIRKKGMLCQLAEWFDSFNITLV